MAVARSDSRCARRVTRAAGGRARIATTQAGGSADRHKGRSRAASKNLIALWKDAGRDLPVLLQARRSMRACNRAFRYCRLSHFCLNCCAMKV